MLQDSSTDIASTELCSKPSCSLIGQSRSLSAVYTNESAAADPCNQAPTRNSCRNNRQVGPILKLNCRLVGISSLTTGGLQTCERDPVGGLRLCYGRQGKHAGECNESVHFRKSARHRTDPLRGCALSNCLRELPADNRQAPESSVALSLMCLASALPQVLSLPRRQLQPDDVTAALYCSI